MTAGTMPPSGERWCSPGLEGACNLRDLGGLPVVGGGVLRHGVLFRSGVLTYLTDADHAALEPLGLRAIVDLRRTDEIAAEPTRWPRPVRIVSFVEDASIARAQAGAPWEKVTSREGILQIMRSAYQSMTEWLKPHLGAIFQLLAEEETPLLFHCAAGKDRTGFCAAVVLLGLGVAPDAVREDYELTNTFDLASFSARRGTGLGVTRRTEMVPEVEAALLRADPDYLRAGLEQIAARFGTVEGYLRDAVGVDDATLTRVRSRLIDTTSAGRPMGD
jgi:protein-tyrosine phosphatase